MPWRDMGLLAIYAATARRQSVAAAKLIEEIIAEAAHDITPREMDRVRTQAKAGLLMSLESSCGQAGYVARMPPLHGPLAYPSEVIRSDERRVGKECVVSRRSRGWPSH